jgi:hypothetical protein
MTYLIRWLGTRSRLLHLMDCRFVTSLYFRQKDKSCIKQIKQISFFSIQRAEKEGSFKERHGYIRVNHQGNSLIKATFSAF